MSGRPEQSSGAAIVRAVKDCPRYPNGSSDPHAMERAQFWATIAVACAIQELTAAVGRPQSDGWPAS